MKLTIAAIIILLAVIISGCTTVTQISPNQTFDTITVNQINYVNGKFPNGTPIQDDTCSWNSRNQTVCVSELYNLLHK